VAMAAGIAPTIIAMCRSLKELNYARQNRLILAKLPGFKLVSFIS